MKRLAIALLLISGPAWGQYLNQGQLAELCEKTDDGATLACLTYVIGVIDGINGNSRIPVVCPGEETSADEVVDLVTEWLNAGDPTPEAPAALSVIAVSQLLFPCG